MNWRTFCLEKRQCWQIRLSLTALKHLHNWGSYRWTPSLCLQSVSLCLGFLQETGPWAAPCQPPSCTRSTWGTPSTECWVRNPPYHGPGSCSWRTQGQKLLPHHTGTLFVLDVSLYVSSLFRSQHLRFRILLVDHRNPMCDVCLHRCLCICSEICIITHLILSRSLVEHERVG